MVAGNYHLWEVLRRAAQTAPPSRGIPRVPLMPQFIAPIVWEVDRVCSYPVLAMWQEREWQERGKRIVAAAQSTTSVLHDLFDWQTTSYDCISKATLLVSFVHNILGRTRW